MSGLALIGYLMIFSLMVIIITKKMSAFSALILIPLVFGIIACIYNGENPFVLGSYISDGIAGIVGTFTTVLFAITYFGLMFAAGLFDPIVDKIVKVVHGDPLRVLVGTAAMAMLVALDGDGSTTYIICATALVPIYDLLKIKKLYLCCLMILSACIMDMMPWGGPTVRAMVTCGLTSDVMFRSLLPSMICGALYVLALAAYFGIKERKRLGIIDVSGSQGSYEFRRQVREDELSQRRPKLWGFILILTLALMVLLVAGLLSANVTFAIGCGITLVVNWHDSGMQMKLVKTKGHEYVTTLAMMASAAVLVGIMSGTGISDAIAHHLSELIPEALGNHFPALLALISLPGDWFLSVDSFYYGVLPILSEAGYAYGFTSVNIAIASIMGQAIHMCSPLVGSFYVALNLTGQDMISVQKIVVRWGLGLFVAFCIGAVATGAFPL